jgi:SPP1 family predicted phage head-tail adaptor
MINSGRLDRRIIIQEKSIVLATNGQQTETWATFLTVWSNPVEKDGFEKTDNNNRSTMRMVFFRVRYNSTITNEMRVVWEGQSYKIEDTKELGRKEGLIINTSLLTQD